MNLGQITVRRGSAQYFTDPVIRVIVPISENNQIIGAVLVYSPIIGVEQAIMKIVTMILYAAVFALIIAVLVGIFLSRSISRPLQNMSEAAISIAKGKKNIKVTVNSDLEELRQFEQTFNYMSEKIDENEMRMKDFVSNVSHELRSPLTAIKGFIEALIDKKAKTPEEQEKYLQIIHRETDHLSGLVTDLLALSSAERNAYARVEKIDVQEFLDHELVNWNEQARTKQIRITLDKAGNMVENEGQNKRQNEGQDPLWIQFDPHALKQILLNLVDNAIKYSKENTEIQILIGREMEEVRISVKDQGPGVPEADLPYIWDRFYRVDKARTKETGGTGLGLAIVKQLVENNRGTVQVTSSKAGSVFSFTAPVTEENEL
jgi:signal transduction histidine kinase